MDEHHGFPVVVGPAKLLGLGFAGLLRAGREELLAADDTWV